MPRLSIWTIRIALVYLALGFTFGALLLFHKGVPVHPAMWSLLPAHIEFLLTGWTLQLALGVAYWILPRFSRGPRRGRSELAWLAVILLNLGVLMAGLGASLGAPALVVLFGRAAQALAALLFALHAWPRVKAAGVG